MRLLSLIAVAIFTCLCISKQPAVGETPYGGNPTGQIAEPNQLEEGYRRAPLLVRKVDFHLRDGRLVVGKMVSEDKNQITVEEILGSRIESATYSKRDVDARTMHAKSMSELRYYLDLAEYFSGRTWDFVDDPDDFIQAIRCYEKAKQLIPAGAGAEEKQRDIDEKIQMLDSDRQVWVRETSSRAELKKLEFEAESEKRFKQLEKALDATDRQAQKKIDDLSKEYDDLRERLSAFSKDLSVEIETMRTQIASNTTLLRRIDDYLRWRTWHPWVPPQQQPQGQNP